MRIFLKQKSDAGIIFIILQMFLGKEKNNTVEKEERSLMNFIRYLKIPTFILNIFSFQKNLIKIAPLSATFIRKLKTTTLEKINI